MARMKQFFKYFIMLILVFIYVTVFTNILTKEQYKDITNYETNVSSPKIEVTESKASNSRGYIRGSITNDTGKHLNDMYLEFKFYNNNIYLGEKKQEIKYFNVGEMISFDIQHDYKNVNKIIINFTGEND